MFMDAEEIIELLDSRWFEPRIFKKQPNPSVSQRSEQNPDHEIEEKPQLSRLPSSLLTRSMSHNQLIGSFKSGLLSPDSVLTPKLQTIVSGKEIAEDDDVKTEEDKTRKVAKRKRKHGESKSLSDLEFEELKGFMDLGFVFSEEDKDSSLAAIIPGLQRLGKDQEQSVNVVAAAEVSRPYLSEAWEDLEKKEKNPLVNWRVPSFSNEMKVKDNLKWWAHAVATTVIK